WNGEVYQNHRVLRFYYWLKIYKSVVKQNRSDDNSQGSISLMLRFLKSHVKLSDLKVDIVNALVNTSHLSLPHAALLNSLSSDLEYHPPSSTRSVTFIQ